jgi:hypothetical protein
MKKAAIDVPVLLIFFTRTEKTVKVFEQIKLARPSKLYLYQDGPRPNREADVYSIKECRQAIESMIDWDCDIHRWYREDNVGCDPSEYLAQKWMFSTEVKGIILEDDDVPSQSFFPFCKELLDKYENDNRINIISGQNLLGVAEECPYDYFFSTKGPIWGWATWKRTIDEWDPKYEFLSDEYTLKMLIDNGDLTPALLAAIKKHIKSGREHYETILSSHRLVQSKLNIIPKYNLISNIGIGEETTHTVSSLNQMPKKIRKIYYQKTYDLEFPLKHPKYVINNIRLTNKLTDCLKFGIIEKLEYRWIKFKSRYKKI